MNCAAGWNYAKLISESKTDALNLNAEASGKQNYASFLNVYASISDSDASAFGFNASTSPIEASFSNIYTSISYFDASIRRPDASVNAGEILTLAQNCLFYNRFRGNSHEKFSVTKFLRFGLKIY